MKSNIYILVFVAFCVSNGQAHRSFQENVTSTFPNANVTNPTVPTLEPGSENYTNGNVTETLDYEDQNSFFNLTTSQYGNETDDNEDVDIIPFPDNKTLNTNQTTTSHSPKTEHVTTATITTAASEIPEAKSTRWWGYLILLLIILLIIALCIILFYLRRVSRTYSFDLHPRMTEPIGTFEPVHLDDFDPRIHTIEPSDSPVANGTTFNEEKGLDGVAAQEEPKTNGLKSTLTSDSSPIPQIETDLDQDQDRDQDQDQDRDQDQLEPELDLDLSPDLFIEETREEQRNENNNNPSICSSDPFVEINLNEPERQLLSTRQSSSVRPFSSSSSS